jgi:3-hydroxyacyl-CoA dehydrogenase/enoyl-CoA hydratase/3-hydroxybutyryl-CoA epimerase
MGLGFPPFRGGPFWWVDQEGAAKIVDRLDALARRHGDRFAPAQIIRDHTESGKSFR